MTAKRLSLALEQYIEDELLRAPLIFDQLLDAISEQARQQRGALAKLDRITSDEAQHMLQQNWTRLSSGYLASLQQQIQESFYAPPKSARHEASKTGGPLVLELVDYDAIALDVEVSRTIQAIKDGSENVLRDLQAYLAAIVGDMDIAEDHNPFHPVVQARALRTAAQALPGQLQHQIAFIRAASGPFAQLLHQSYSASCARLEDMGVEPATHRTVLMSDGSKRLEILPDVAYVPDLQRIRDAMPRTVRRSLWRERVHALARGDFVTSEPGVPAFGPAGAGAAPAADVAELQRAREAQELRNRGMADRQAVELVNRLFRAFALDERVPKDVADMIALLRGPAMRLTLRDPSVLDKREHPLWRFIHVFAYQAEMAPNPDDPERQRWLSFGQQAIEGLAAQAIQKAASYQSAVDRLEGFLSQRLARRCTALMAQMNALQKTEAGLAALRPAEGAMVDGPIEDPPLDTVPASLLPPQIEARLPDDAARAAAAAWLDELVPGQWVRLLLKGKWVHAQLLWRGERGQILLFGDGASDTSWAVRRGVLLRMHIHSLAKTLTVRTLVGAAAMRVRDQLAIADSA